MDVGGAAEEHHQPVDADRDAGGGADEREQIEKFIVERIVAFAQSAALLPGGLEARELFGSVAKFGEAVAEFESVAVEFPAFRDGTAQTGE